MLTDNSEFNEIYDRYKNLVLKAAYEYSGSRDIAEDVTQETFFKLYKNFDRYKKENIAGLLYVMSRNEALNYRKKYKREVLVNKRNEDETEGTDVFDIPTDSAETEFINVWKDEERHRLHEKIFDELGEKNPRWLECIVYVYYMEIPQAEVAEMMGIRLQVLHSLLHRAKKWIKKKYGVEYEEMNREE